jgi:hypothetical protein
MRQVDWNTFEQYNNQTPPIEKDAKYILSMEGALDVPIVSGELPPKLFETTAKVEKVLINSFPLSEVFGVETSEGNPNRPDTIYRGFVSVSSDRNAISEFEMFGRKPEPGSYLKFRGFFVLDKHKEEAIKAMGGMKEVILGLNYLLDITLDEIKGIDERKVGNFAAYYSIDRRFAAIGEHAFEEAGVPYIIPDRIILNGLRL